MGKPDGLIIVKKGDEQRFLAPLEVSKLWGVGPKTASTLAKYHIYRVGDLAKKPVDWLIDNFGNNITLISKSLKLPLSLHGPVIQLREVSIGEKVSYGGVDITIRKSRLATFGIGYAEGWIRRLKPNSSFLIMGKKCKIIGNIYNRNKTN